MKLEQYLRSAATRVDVARCLAGGLAQAEGLGMWVRGWFPPWSALFFGDRWVYWKPAGKRFVVSDLGHGAMEFRRRLGELQRPASSVYYLDMPKRLRVGLVLLSNESVVTAYSRTGIESVTSKMLPDAICRVMLASFRIENLEMKP